MITQDRIDGVLVVTMDAGENRFNRDFVAELDETLAKAAEAGGPLVLTGSGKFFSNGLDLDWLGDAPSDEATATFAQLYRAMARLLAFPGATVAALNGHAFGAGLILAATADVRVMREDRGYACLPEVDLSMTMSPEFDAVLRTAFPLPVYREAYVTGRRYAGPAAVEAGLVHAVASEETLVATAIDRVRDQVGKPAGNVAAIKRQLHADALAVLER
jgi:enoyl-CoA hydratase/carnithine racemase